MKIKIFTTSQSGYITLTTEELQKLLDEAYQEGVNDGKYSIPSITWTNADATIKDYSLSSPITTNCAQNNIIEHLKCETIYDPSNESFGLKEVK